MLKTKSFFHKAEVTDGFRLSIMNAHTHDGGYATRTKVWRPWYQEHWPLLGPSANLLADLHRGHVTWEVFAQRYREGLYSERSRHYLVDLLQKASTTMVTLLSDEPRAEQSIRRLLALECNRQVPRIRVLEIK